MHLIFFDEVKCQPDYPYYHIGAIVIEEGSFSAIEKEVNVISESVFGTTELGKETEFHAKDIFHRKSAFKEIYDPIKRFEILVSLLAVLSREEISRIDIQIYAENLYNSSYADDYAFMFLCERANQLMKVKKSIGMLIGDRDSDKMSNKFSTALSKYRCRGTQFEYKENITHLFESVHFTPSHLSRFLQLADIYAWYVQFCRRHDRSDSKYSHFYELLESKNVKLFPTKYRKWPTK